MAENTPLQYLPTHGPALDRMIANITAGLDGKLETGSADQQANAANRTARHLQAAILSQAPAENLTMHDRINYLRLEHIVAQTEQAYITIDGGFRGIGNFVEGNVELLKNPGKAMQGLTYAATHPGETMDAIALANRQKLASILVIDNDWERVQALAAFKVERMANAAQVVLGGTGLVRGATTVAKDATVAVRQAATELKNIDFNLPNPTGFAVATANATASVSDAGVLIKAAATAEVKSGGVKAAGWGAMMASGSLDAASRDSANQMLVRIDAVPLEMETMPTNIHGRQASAIGYQVADSHYHIRLIAVVDNQFDLVGHMQYRVNPDSSVYVEMYDTLGKWRGNGLSTSLFKAVILEEGSVPEFKGSLGYSNLDAYRNRGLDNTPWAKSLRALGYESQIFDMGPTKINVRSTARAVETKPDDPSAFLINQQSSFER